MMEYKITTLQYGSLKDTYEYRDINALLHDLANIAEMKTIEVLSITRNEQPIAVYYCHMCGREIVTFTEKNGFQPKECLRCRIKGATKKRR
jgi:DNA replicative helicase MCM subunit Mcm2 (Cdc46/Mcm family)